MCSKDIFNMKLVVFFGPWQTYHNKVLRLLAERSVDTEVSPGMTETIDISPSGITRKCLYLKIYIDQIFLFISVSTLILFINSWSTMQTIFETIEGSTLSLAKRLPSRTHFSVNLLGAKQIILSWQVWGNTGTTMLTMQEIDQKNWS